MNQTLLDKLYADYPGLFIKFSEDKSIPEHYPHIYCRDGWYPLLHDLCAVLADHIQHYIPEELQSQVYVTYIKEKFGTLRFHINHWDDYMMGAMTMAEGQSGRICEVCGHPGSLHNISGWLQTLCLKDSKKETAAVIKRNKEYAKKLKDKKKNK
jgi:hypothetical protein